MQNERILHFGKGKGRPPVIVPNSNTKDRAKLQEKVSKKPSPSTTLTDASRKWHETRRPGK